MMHLPELAWAGLATAGFAFLFDLRVRDLPLAVLGASLGWWIYSSFQAAGDSAIGLFAAAAAIGLISEAGALIFGKPAFLYMVCSILPLVPGSGMYNTMLQSVRGDLPGSIAIGFATLQSAGAIAAGLAVASALARLLSFTALARRIRDADRLHGGRGSPRPPDGGADSGTRTGAGGV